MWIRFIALVVLAYLVGAITPAHLAAKLARGIDLREFGTRNIGTSNLYQATGKKKSILVPVIIFDLAKSWPLLWAARVLLPGDMAYWGEAAAAAAAVVGHSWPVYLNFQGGRGMLATLGIALFMPVVTGLAPWPVAVGVSIVLLGTFALRNAPLGVVSGVTALPIVSWLVGEPLALILGYLGIVAVMIIRRLAQPRREISARVKLSSVLLNRLLFDRDIRDREAWLKDTSAETSGRREKS